MFNRNHSLKILARDVIEWLEDYDPYDFMDDAPTGMTRSEAIDYAAEQQYHNFLDGRYVKETIQYIEGCVEDGYLDRRTDGILARLRRLLRCRYRS